MSPRRCRLRIRQAEEVARFVSDVGEVEQAERFPDHVEQVTMFARRRVGPFARRPLGRIDQPHKHRRAEGIAHIANEPIAARAATVGEIASAHRLSLSAETLREIGSVAGHHAAPRSEMRSIA